ncbi:hypothetical protein H9X85_12515 [Anaerotignum lactatifermentans]|uniref:YbbR-like protein n=1 Tax=Anaerotignum lactatifermentans TaxID=160404 RepID=A0ABS2GCS1_9FIRM|nr:CdaR family protein [Anaerotignum lactatifermentans]MBM6830431.1 hypothetical protein [Anaerotignum lactatifermentans]MBM6878962.1 hypothetical protein [Anaerotignum lactatifermentans]MBM6952002.1 hypothetical protein [Anaerotignum lactatifermentans]
MKRFQELLMKDLGWKLLSIAIAAIMWFMVISIDQPEDTRTYSTPLQITGMESLTAQGLTIANWEELSETKINIKIKGQRTALDRLSQQQSDMITAEVDAADLGYVSSGDVRTAEVKVTLPSGSGYVIVSKSPSAVELSIETLVSKEFPVEISMNGMAEGSENLSEPQLSIETVMVKGAKSAVDRVASVRATVSAADAVEQGVLESKLVAYDAEGETVSGISFSQDTVTVSYLMQDEKQIPLQVEISGTPAEGYHILEITTTPESITVVGEEDALERLSYLSLEPIDVAGRTTSTSRTFRLEDYLPDGVRIKDGASQSVQVMVHIARSAETTVWVPSSAITLLNMNSQYTYELPSSVAVTLVGEEDLLTSVDTGRISATVDVSGLETGTHQAEILWQLPEGISTTDTVLSVMVTAAGGDREENNNAEF